MGGGGGVTGLKEPGSREHPWQEVLLSSWLGQELKLSMSFHVMRGFLSGEEQSCLGTEVAEVVSGWASPLQSFAALPFSQSQVKWTSLVSPPKRRTKTFLLTCISCYVNITQDMCSI